MGGAGLIKPRHQKGIMSAGPVCTAFKQSVEKCVMTIERSLSSAEATVRPSAPHAARTDFPLSTVLTGEEISTADTAEDKPDDGGMKCEYAG